MMMMMMMTQAKPMCQPAIDSNCLRKMMDQKSAWAANYSKWEADYRVSIIIIIITRPKPAYGRQGLAGSWGQDTDNVSNFWVFLTSHFAQLGNKPTWDHS